MTFYRLQFWKWKRWHTCDRLLTFPEASNLLRLNSNDTENIYARISAWRIIEHDGPWIMQIGQIQP